MKTPKLYIILLVVILGLFPGGVNGQIPAYRAVKRVGYNVFNLRKAAAQRLYDCQSCQDLRVVFSDRSCNKVYNTAFGQRTVQEVPLGEAYYVIGENNDSYQLVKADPKLLGSPHGLFGFLFKSDNHFKDGANTPLTGWIPKSNLLLYDHSFVSSDNHFPIRFMIGISSINRLFDLKRYAKGDSINVFDDPFLQKMDKEKFVMGQIVYAYKYDDKNRVVLVSDKPNLFDKNRKVLGWIPADLILEIGQYHVFKMDGAHGFDKIVTLSNDTLSVRPIDLQSNLLFSDDGMVSSMCMADSLKSNYKVVDFPISVWDGTKNKLINVRGGDIMVRDISKMIHGQKTTNIHLFVFANDRNNIKRLASSFQNISLNFDPSRKYTFSATIISNRGNIYLNSTENFAHWLDFLANLPAEDKNKNDSGMEAAFKHLIQRLVPDNFEDNVLIILGSNQALSFPARFKKELAKRSFSISFIQVFGDATEKGQDYLLKAKDIIYDNISSYTDYITNYIVDPKLLKSSLFLKYGEEDNVFLLDAPQNSLATGGIVFPKSNEHLSPGTVSLVMDTLLNHIKQRNEALESSLLQYKKKLGVLRSVPSHILCELHKNSNDSSRCMGNIDRNAISDTYLLHAMLPDSLLSKQSEGYLLTLEETKTLLQNYRDLLPVFSDSIGKKEFRILRRILNKQKRLINKKNYSHLLCRKSRLSDLFYYKTGIPVNDAILYNLTTPELTTDLLELIDWNGIYRGYINKIDRLEEKLIDKRLEKISIGGANYYFILRNDLP